ncbi:MAG: hypothetical protein DIU78_006535 [Pseudomonadota bacterium]
MDPLRTLHRVFPVVALLAAVACSDDDGDDGSSGTGGTKATGGSAGSSGKGGASSSGGSGGKGGDTTKGGSSSQGGSSGGQGGGSGGSSSGSGGMASAGAGGNAGGDSGAGGTAGSAEGGAAGDIGFGGSGGNLGGAGGAAHAGEAGSGGDASGTTPTVDACLDLATAHETQTELLELEGDGVIVGIVRYMDPESFGTSGTTPWLPDTLAVAYDAGTVCIRDAAALTYTISHHNFDDTLTAKDGDRTWTFRQEREDYDFPTVWTVSATEGGSTVLGPVELTLVECRFLGSNEDCSQRYE